MRVNVLTYGGCCVEGLQAGSQGLQDWGAVRRGAWGGARLVHGDGLALPAVGVGEWVGRGGGGGGGCGQRQRVLAEPSQEPCLAPTQHPSGPAPLPMTPTSDPSHPTADGPPSRLTPPQQAVLCLRPGDLQEG